MIKFFNKAKLRNNTATAAYCEYSYVGIIMLICYIIIAVAINHLTNIDLYNNFIIFVLFFSVTFVFLWGTSSHYVINDRYVFSRIGFSFNLIKLQDIHFCTLLNNHITLYRLNGNEIRLDFSNGTNSDSNLFIDKLQKHNILITHVQTTGHGNPVSFPWDEFVMRKTLAFPDYMNFIFAFFFFIVFLSYTFDKVDLSPRNIVLLLLSVICITQYINALFIKINVSHDGLKVKNFLGTKFIPFGQISNAKTQKITVSGFERMHIHVEALFLYHDDKLIKIPCKITRYYTNYDLLIASLHNHGIQTK